MIRVAEQKDVIGVLKLIRSNKKVVMMDCAEEVFSSQVTSLMISRSINSGLTIVCVEGEEVIGVCLGVCDLNAFCDRAKSIQLLVNLMKEEHRGTQKGGRMFLRWMSEMDAVCLEDQDVKAIFVGEQPEGTNINFKKRGFKISSISWVRET